MAAVAASDLVAVEAGADAGAMTIRDTHASRANHAGRFVGFCSQPESQWCGPALQAITSRRNCECHEDDQLLLNARRNRRANKNSATRPSAGFSAKQDKPEGEVVDEMQELRELAEAQAALFRIGTEDEAEPEHTFIPSPKIGR